MDSSAGALSEKRREQLKDIDPSWCPSWPVERQRCFHLVRIHLEAGHPLSTEPGDVTHQGDDEHETNYMLNTSPNRRLESTHRASTDPGAVHRMNLDRRRSCKGPCLFRASPSAYSPGPGARSSPRRPLERRENSQPMLSGASVVQARDAGLTHLVQMIL